MLNTTRVLNKLLEERDVELSNKQYKDIKERVSCAHSMAEIDLIISELLPDYGFKYDSKNFKWIQ